MNGEGEIERIVRDLGTLAREAPKELAARVASLPLSRQAEIVLRLPGKERLEFLLHAPQPMRLVRTLPDSEVYLTVREVGPSDALALLSLASADQLRHVIDLEAWRKDRFDADRAGAWLALFLEGGEPTALRFLRQADEEILVLLFARWAGVRQIEIEDTPAIHGQAEADAAAEEGFPSPDGIYRFTPTIPEHAPAIRRIAEILFQDDPARYERILWAALYEISSEIEEGALHWRQSRLEEHGFPPWEEALTVYAPAAGIGTSAEPPGAAEDAQAAPRAALRHAEPGALLVRAIDALDDASRERVLLQLTGVANRLLVADGSDTADTTAHADALGRTASYVSIALLARGARDGVEAAAVLRDVPPLELFREGFARAVAVAERARRLVGTGWPSVDPRALELLPDLLRSRIEGLLRMRPVYYQLLPTGPEYREFRSLEEIEETRVSLELVEVLGRVMAETLGWDLPRVVAGRESPPRFSALFLTSLAWHAQTGALQAGPLAVAAASRFRAEVSVPGQDRALLSSFLERIVADAALDARAALELEAFGRASLVALEEDDNSLMVE